MLFHKFCPTCKKNLIRYEEEACNECKMPTINRKELEAWQEYILNKPCPKHPNRLIKEGRFGLWCGVKEFNGYCDGGFPTQEFITNFRKEQNAEN